MQRSASRSNLILLEGIEVQDVAALVETQPYVELVDAHLLD